MNPRTYDSLPAVNLPKWSPQLKAELASLYERVQRVIPEVEWAVHAPYIAAIRELKRQRNAVILAHNYQTPEIFYGIADITGDSLALAQLATQTDADVIVQCGVHFMAETSKILNPRKTVIIPSADAGCSLAASITGADVRMLKQRYPGVPVVTYVNTSAEVKAETDICCTSSNAVDVVKSLKTDRVIFIPDKYLGSWVAKQVGIDMIFWEGSCEVHEQFTAEDLRNYRKQTPGVHILAHPECPPDVLNEADFVGSTSGMVSHLRSTTATKVVMVTECSMSDNVAAEFPDLEFVRPCNLCPHMKQITLPRVLESLRTMQPQVEVDPDIAARARRAVERMLEVSKAPAASGTLGQRLAS